MSGLPKGWGVSSLDTLCTKLRGVSYAKDEVFAAPQKDTKPVLRANNIENDILIFDNLVWVVDSRIKKQQLLKRGDIVVAMSSGSKKIVGKTAQTMDDWDGAFGAFCGVLRPSLEINNRYLGLFLRTQEYRDKISELSAGSNINNLKNEHFAEIKVPLPPLNEQRRIVAKLEEVLVNVDASQKRLTRILVILKRFRQAVLAAACSGRLTADWREKHGIREGDDLPEGWQRLSLRGLCDGFQYGTSTKSEPSGKVPVIRMGNIQNGKIDWTNLAYTSDAVEIKKYRLNPGDVLFNRTNSPELVGKTAIYRGEQPAIFAGYLIKIKNRSALDSEYLNYCLNSFHAKEWCQQVKTDGVSQSNINAQKLADYEINFPPLPEQQEIVRRVESYFTLADQLETRYQKAKTHIDRLTQSILAKAFRGELVPQDPNDEPASALLERVRTQGYVSIPPKKKKELSDITVPKKRRAQTIEPPPVVATFEVKSLSAHARKIYRYMKRNREYSKDEIVVPLILSTSEWNSAIRELKESGEVVQTGDKRGARYSKHT